jgi:hypothetical protein
MHKILGLEIYAAVMKVKACQNVRDNAYDAVKNMRKANKDMNDMLVNVREYQRRVTVEVPVYFNYIYMISQL